MKNDLPDYNEYVQLWLAVISQAIEDASLQTDGEIPIQGNPEGVTYTESQWTQRRARLWLNSKEIGPGSLNWITTVLNLDASAIRSEYKRRLEVNKASQTQANQAAPVASQVKWDLLTRRGKRG